MPTANSGDVNTSTKTGVKEYVFAKMATQQTTNVAANDHLKFDTVLTSRGGSVALDTTTAYSNTAGAASIGRFTLKAGLTYKLTAGVPYILGSGATGLLEATWYDATSGANLPGSPLTALVATTATNDIGGDVACAIFTPTQDTLVEVRITTGTALTQIGTTAARHPWALVETI